MKPVARIERSRVRRTRKTAVDGHVCLACGGPIEDCLARGGSLRCHDCRDRNAPLTDARVKRRTRSAVARTLAKRAA